MTSRHRRRCRHRLHKQRTWLRSVQHNLVRNSKKAALKGAIDDWFINSHLAKNVGYIIERLGAKRPPINKDADVDLCLHFLDTAKALR